MPWNRPFESAATPGDARVTSELRPEDWLSSGSFSNAARSMSEWKVGSLSVVGAAVTSTTVEVPLTASLALTVRGTKERISMD